MYILVDNVLKESISFGLSLEECLADQDMTLDDFFSDDSLDVLEAELSADEASAWHPCDLYLVAMGLELDEDRETERWNYVHGIDDDE